MYTALTIHLYENPPNFISTLVTFLTSSQMHYFHLGLNSAHLELMRLFSPNPSLPRLTNCWLLSQVPRLTTPQVFWVTSLEGRNERSNSAIRSVLWIPPAPAFSFPRPPYWCGWYHLLRTIITRMTAATFLFPSLSNIQYHLPIHLPRTLFVIYCYYAIVRYPKHSQMLRGNLG